MHASIVCDPTILLPNWNKQESDLYRLHYDAVTKDPFISKALGPNPKLERMKAASLRLGGQGLSTTYDNHLLIIGDAAGHIDPLTGEGIHTAIMGGKAAAETILEARECGNYSRYALQKYEARWIKLYGHDFALVRCAYIEKNTCATLCVFAYSFYFALSAMFTFFPRRQTLCMRYSPRPAPTSSTATPSCSTRAPTKCSAWATR